MDVKLKVLNGAHAGRQLPLKGPKFFIGRSEDCHLRPKSDLISRHHCVLLLDDDCVAVRDLGSRNGTMVNDERIAGEVELKTGDRLQVGPLEFEVMIAIAEKPKKRPKVRSIKEAVARTAETAAQNESEDTIDVTSFFVEEDAHTKTDHSVRDTLVGQAPETEEISLGDTQPGMPSAETSPPAAADARSDTPASSVPPAKGPAETKKKTPPRPPRKAPTVTADDSGTAAAEALRRFLNRR